MEPILTRPDARPPPAPELGRVVVRSRDEQVPERVVREGPDVAVVRVLERFFRGGVGEGPVQDRAFRAAGDEDVRVDRVPGEGCKLRVGGPSRGIRQVREQDQGSEGKRKLTANLLLVPSQRDKLFHRADIKHLDELVARRGRDHVSVRRPRERLDRVLVPVPARRPPLGSSSIEPPLTRHDKEIED